MNASETILYMRDNTGAIREWAISCSEDTIIIRYGQKGGAMQYQKEVVEHGKATRSLEEQIQSRMASRILKQRDKGYVPCLDEAKFRGKTVNTLGLPKPMLAQKIDKVKNINYTHAVIQPKFDGNRCLIYRKDGVNRAYTRNGKHIESIDHILADLELWDGMIVDGELYCHGYPLQTIVSWIKRKQENTLKLNYHLYDVVAPNSTYKTRSELIRTIPKGKAISPVYGDPIASYEDALVAFRGFRAQGYEGAILRTNDTGYEDGKRSKSLIKIKEWEDDEFYVIDVHPSSDGWGILECQINDRPAGDTFRVSAPGTIEQKREILLSKVNYIGRRVTVEYANITADGVPFHPVAINFREDIQ